MNAKKYELTVHELERSDGRTRLLELAEEDGTEEEDEETHAESDLLHSTTSVELVIDEEHGEVITDEGNGSVEQVVLPGDDEGSSWMNDSDENTREDLATVYRKRIEA